MASVNVDRLRAEGILPADVVLSAEDEYALDSLTPAEVDAIVSIRNKLGPGFMARNFYPRFIF
jgi:hypothetical protein